MNEYLALSERVTDRRLQNNRPDGAEERKDSIFVALKCPEGVYLEKSSEYASESNGITERSFKNSE